MGRVSPGGCLGVGLGCIAQGGHRGGGWGVARVSFPIQIQVRVSALPCVGMRGLPPTYGLGGWQEGASGS